MEIILILAFLFILWIIFKILAAIFYAGAFLITLPLKIIFFVLLLLLFIPLGLVSLIVGIILPFLPFVLLGVGLYYLLRKN